MLSIIVGLSACGITSISFGSMYVAIKHVGNPGDGFVVQWLVCSAIFLCGFLTYLFTRTPGFQLLAMLGGMFWALGNLTALPLIKMLGIGLSGMIFRVVTCVVGWATGRFGLFGTKASVPSSPVLNYVGVFLVIIGGILFAFVRPKNQGWKKENENVPNEEYEDDTAGLLFNNGIIGEDGMELSEENIVVTHQDEREEDQQQQELSIKMRIFAIALAIFAGLLNGLMFTPVIYMQDNPDKFHPRPPEQGIHYVFSHFSGVYLTSTAVLCAYIAYKNNRPSLNNRLIFPALLAGFLWAGGMLSLFWANDLVSQAITYPITISGSSAICSLWSVLYFKEVARKELKKFCLALLVTTLGVSFVGLSKAI